MFSNIEVYVSDFGTLKVVPNRFMPTDRAYILEMDKFKLAYLRPYAVTDLAKTGDNMKKEMVVEYTLESLQEAASGQVSNLA